jgi:hypothetical protein
MSKLPAPSAVGARLDDLELLREYRRTEDLSAVAAKYGLRGPQEASKAINKALNRLDKRLLGHAGALRAQEFLRLEAIDEDLGRAGYEDPEHPGVWISDPKVAAEKRLLSESRRRLYGLDVKGEAEVQAPVFNVLFQTPAERGVGGAQAGEITDGEYEVVEPPALPPGGEGEVEGS